MKIGKRIRALREENKINRETLAKSIGINVRTISYWENEIYEPQASYIIKLADYFDISTDYLLGREN